MRRYMTMQLKLWLLLPLLICDNAAAAIIPVWSTPNNTRVTVPAGSSRLFRARGYVSSVFDSMLMFDTSGSMADAIPANIPPASNGGRQRGDWALDGAKVLIDELADVVRLGLVDFDDGARLVTPVDELGPAGATPSHRQILKTALLTLNRSGGTNIANAIKFATQQLINLPDASDSQHLFLLTDGQPTSGDAIAETRAALQLGIDSVHTIALPGADVAYLQQIANVGNGIFVDGTDLTRLLDKIRELVDGAETLERLDIELPDGSLFENVMVGPDGSFTIEGLITEGNNLFRAHATSSRGGLPEVRELNVIGVVPEPPSALLAAFGVGALAVRRWPCRAW